MNIRIIGYGRLAQQIVKTWATHHHLTISSPNIQKTQDHTFKIADNNTLFLDDQDLIVLAVKPKIIDLVINEITPFLNEKTLIVSLAAGITLNHLKTSLPKNVNVIRAMPNIASGLGQSASLLLGKENLCSQQINQLEMTFSQLGTIHWVSDDNQLDIGTILAGSGPAYVFYIMDALQQSAINLGLPESLAKQLVTQTFLGASMLAQLDHQSLNQLQEQVTSPKGTTASALAVFENKQLKKCLDEAINAAWQKVIKIRGN